jgi:RNA polymerase-binding transcription factor DksA
LHFAEKQENLMVENERLSDKELLRFRNLLIAEKQKVLETKNEIMENIVGQATFDSIGENTRVHRKKSSGDLAAINYDRELNVGLAERQIKYLEQIDDALLRIADKTYGICQVTGKIIPTERLESVLTTKYSLEGKEKLKRDNLG